MFFISLGPLYTTYNDLYYVVGKKFDSKVILRQNFEKKKFSKKFSKNFFGHMGGYIEKKEFFVVSEKKFFPPNSLEIINVRTNPLQKYIFFKNFISKIFRN